MLATEVLISLPRITAMEYGDLELSLIPTVFIAKQSTSITFRNRIKYSLQMIGTTITYLVILCQFEV